MELLSFQVSGFVVTVVLAIINLACLVISVYIIISGFQAFIDALLGYSVTEEDYYFQRQLERERQSRDRYRGYRGGSRRSKSSDRW